MTFDDILGCLQRVFSEFSEYDNFSLGLKHDLDAYAVKHCNIEQSRIYQNSLKLASVPSCQFL